MTLKEKAMRRRARISAKTDVRRQLAEERALQEQSKHAKRTRTPVDTSRTSRRI
jgi:hypothetical protein